MRTINISDYMGDNRVRHNNEQGLVPIYRTIILFIFVAGGCLAFMASLFLQAYFVAALLRLNGVFYEMYFRIAIPTCLANAIACIIPCIIAYRRWKYPLLKYTATFSIIICIIIAIEMLVLLFRGPEIIATDIF